MLPLQRFLESIVGQDLQRFLPETCFEVRQREYIGTSDKGPSKKGTISLQSKDTLHCPRRDSELKTMTGSKVCPLFDCSTCISTIGGLCSVIRLYRAVAYSHACLGSLQISRP